MCAKRVLGAIVHGENPQDEGLTKLVRVLAQLSGAFTMQLSKHLSSKLNSELSEVELKFLATIWTNSSAAIPGKDLDCTKIIENCQSPAAAMDLGAAILGRRREMYYFPTKETEEESQRLQSVLVNKGNRWDYYRLGCHAMTVGDFLFATLIFDDLAKSSLSEDHFLWIAALKNVAMAEALLGSLGSDGIPDASSLIHTSLSYLHHLDTTNNTKTPRGFAFQSRLLFLRLDQLDLVTVIRQLTRETRLTGDIPHKNTRHHQHLVNATRGLESLGLRYRQLNQKYGLHFQSNLSTSSLLAQQDVCNFLSRATKVFFAEIFPSFKSPNVDGGKSRNSYKFLPNKLMNELDSHFLNVLDNPMEPLVRAAALLELLEGMIKVPNTLPRDFFSPRPIILSDLKLSAVPSENAEYGADSCDVIEALPSICFYCAVNGKIPTKLIQQATKRPIVSVFVWCNLVYLSAVEDEEAREGPDKETVRGRIPDIRGPHELISCADGRFYAELELPPLTDEGTFLLEMKLGCRDSAGAEWELQVRPSSCQIVVRSSRSR